MKKEEIEARDQELVKQFREMIRSKEKPPEETPPPRRFPLKGILLFAALGLSGILFITQPWQSPLAVPETAVPPSLQQEITPKEQITSEAELPPEEEPQIADTARQEIPPAPPKGEVALQQMATIAPIPGSTESLSLQPFLQPLIEPAPLPAPKPAPHKQEGDMASDLRVEQILACQGVANRQYTRPSTTFSLADQARPWVWMEVTAENPPSTLTHVYYCNGEKYCEVPLAIGYQRTRTWSRISLISPEHIGNWRVEVVDNGGATLDQIEFSVVE